jgi:hypothetical protein
MALLGRLLGEPPMPPVDADFSFVIKFERGRGDPRRVFNSASHLIDGFERLDGTVVGSIDNQLRTVLVLEDVEAASIRVWLKSILSAIDDRGLKEGEWKKAIGPALVEAKHLAIKALDNDETKAPQAIHQLRHELEVLVARTDVKHLPAYAPIHEGRLISALDKIQDGKRVLGPSDKLSIESNGEVYEVDLTKTWEPSENMPIPDAKEQHGEGEVILTIRKPDLLGATKWQFTHGQASIFAPIRDQKWLDDFHARKIPLHPGDALRCRVKFIYLFDANGSILEQKTEIVQVLEVIQGPEPQRSLFEEENPS